MRKKSTREDKDLVADNVSSEKVDEIMIRIVHLNDGTRKSISSDDVKDEAYGIKILERFLTSDQKKLVNLVVKKLE